MLQVTLLSYSMLTAMLTPDMTEDGPWEFESEFPPYWQIAFTLVPCKSSPSLEALSGLQRRRIPHPLTPSRMECADHPRWSSLRPKKATVVGRPDLPRTNVLENEITFQFQRLEPIAIDGGCHVTLVLYSRNVKEAAIEEIYSTHDMTSPCTLERTFSHSFLICLDMGRPLKAGMDGRVRVDGGRADGHALSTHVRVKMVIPTAVAASRRVASFIWIEAARRRRLRP